MFPKALVVVATIVLLSVALATPMRASGDKHGELQAGYSAVQAGMKCAEASTTPVMASSLASRSTGNDMDCIDLGVIKPRVAVAMTTAKRPRYFRHTYLSFK
jgi:hypothetical protein